MRRDISIPELYIPNELNVYSPIRSASLRNVSFLVNDEIVWKFRSMKSYFDCLAKLGSGAQGIVFLLKHTVLNQPPVVAKIYKDTLENRRRVTNEIQVLQRLNADGCKQFLLCYQEHFITDTKSLPIQCASLFTSVNESLLIVIYDYFFGENTLTLDTFITPSFQESEEVTSDLLQSSETFSDKTSGIEEDESEDNQQIILFLYGITKTLLKAVNFLHTNFVAHLDIKPANVVVNVPKKRIQLIDFGLACMENTCEPGGTLEYMAPEVVKLLGTKNNILSFDSAKKADSWSIGVMLFKFINNETPFRISGLTIFTIGTIKQEKIKKSSFYDSDYPEFSLILNDIIDRFLQVKPTERLDVSQAYDMIKHVI